MYLVHYVYLWHVIYITAQPWRLVSPKTIKYDETSSHQCSTAEVHQCHQPQKLQTNRTPDKRPHEATCHLIWFVFQQHNDPKRTSNLCKGHLTKKEADEVSHDLTSTITWSKPNWGALGWVGPQVSTSGNSFKTVSGDDLMTQNERTFKDVM